MIRRCLCMFRKGRSLSLWLHFRLHFGVALGAQFLTILLFGAPDGRNRATKKSRHFYSPLSWSLSSFFECVGYFVRRVLARVCARFRGWKNQEGRQKKGKALKCRVRGCFFCALLQNMFQCTCLCCFFVLCFQCSFCGAKKVPLKEG